MRLTTARWKGGLPCSAHQPKKSSNALAYIWRVTGLETALSTSRCSAAKSGCEVTATEVELTLALLRGRIGGALPRVDRKLVGPHGEMPRLDMTGPGAVEPAEDLDMNRVDFGEQFGSEMPVVFPFELGLAGEAQAAVEVGFEEGKQRLGAGIVGGLRVVLRGGQARTAYYKSHYRQQCHQGLSNRLDKYLTAR